ncbi:hypothetical protein Tco_1338474 [Tanacetum coccineum]
MDTELVEGSKVRVEGSETREESSSKRAEDELEQEKAKKQKVDEDKETTKLQSLMKVIPDEEEVAVDAIPLATKPPSIGRIVGINKLLPAKQIVFELSLTKPAKLMLLVQKLLLLVLKVNAAAMKVTTAERLQLPKEFMLTEKR